LNVLWSPTNSGIQGTLNPPLSDDNTRRFSIKEIVVVEESQPIAGDWTRKNCIVYPSEIRLD
jgi:hypothetical protein